MKRIIFFTFMVGLLGTGCGGNRNENTDSMDDRGTMEEPGYRDGTLPRDTTLRDTTDSVLHPTPPPATP